MLPETERHDRTATTAATGVSASQADLSAPLIERPAEPETAKAQGGEDASRPASTAARTTDGESAPDQPASDARDAGGATETAASGSAAIEIKTDSGSAEAAESDEGAARLDTRGDGRVDSTSREGDGATGSSTSIDLHNEIVLSMHGGADGATPSPGSAWSEMNERLDAARADALEMGGVGAAMNRMADRMDDIRDRIDSVLGGDEAGSGVSDRLHDLRDQAEDFLSGSNHDASSSLLDDVRAQFDGLGATEGGGLLQQGADLLDAARATIGADDKSDEPILEGTDFLQGLESIRADAGDLLDRDAVGTDAAATHQSPSLLAALFDGDLASSAGEGPSIAQFHDLGLDDSDLGDVNLPNALGVNHPGEGFAFDPPDVHF